MFSKRIFAFAILAVSACSNPPSDVSPGLQPDGFGPVGQRPLNGQISATPYDGGTAGGGEFGSSIEQIAAGAIAEAEQGGSGSGGGGGVFDNIQPQSAADVLPPPIIPRVAAFAIRTTHAPGQRQWRRNPFRRSNAASCANYESRDLAQDAFLREGGPERDPLGLDPDGDGFVCGFDPAGYRADAAQANQPAPDFGVTEQYPDYTGN